MKQMDPMVSALACVLADFRPSPQALQQMAQHLCLLQRWNQRINLTAVTETTPAAWLHYRDSLMGLACLTAGPVVDFGSGAGFPAIPLAIMRPTWQFTCVEPRRKRVSFLQLVVAQLALHNVTICLGRLGDAPDKLYAHAVTRATFSDTQSFNHIARWLQPGGTLVAYRGADTAASPAEGYWIQGRLHGLQLWQHMPALLPAMRLLDASHNGKTRST